MFCQNCGHQNPNNINFCQNCGSNLNAGNFQQNVNRLKTKEEYMKDYKANNPMILVYRVIAIIFDTIGLILLVIKTMEIYKIKSYTYGYIPESYGREYLFNIFIALVLLIVSIIFNIASRSIYKKGLQEYENYYLVNYSNNNARSASVSNNGWTCQKCGMNNTSSSSTCGNCGSSRPGSVRRTASDNEWKCPSCGRINQNYVGTCGCGARKP